MSRLRLAMILCLSMLWAMGCDRSELPAAPADPPDLAAAAESEEAAEPAVAEAASEPEAAGEDAPEAGTEESTRVAEIRAALDPVRQAIRACYQRALNENPELEGRVRFRFEVDAEGAVAQALVVESDFPDVTSECMSDAIRQQNFGAGDEDSVWIEAPFVFTPGDATP